MVGLATQQDLPAQRIECPFVRACIARRITSLTNNLFKIINLSRVTVLSIISLVTMTIGFLSSFAGLELDTFETNMMQLRLYLSQVPCIMTGNMDLIKENSPREFLNSLTKLLLKVTEQSLNPFVNVTPSDRLTIKQGYDAKTRMQLSLRRCFVRIQPFGVIMAGPPGSGKTHGLNKLCSDLYKLDHDNFDRDTIVVLNESDKFQSEFQTHHKIVIFDDLGATLADYAGEDPFRKIIDFINNVPKTALKPEVDLKGCVWIEPDIVGATTNMIIPFEERKGRNTESVLCPDAINRRFKLKVWQTGYDEFRIIPNDFVPIVKDNRLWNTNHLDLPIINYEKLFHIAKTLYLEHMESQRSYLSLTETLYPSPLKAESKTIQNDDLWKEVLPEYTRERLDNAAKQIYNRFDPVPDERRDYDLQREAFNNDLEFQLSNLYLREQLYDMRFDREYCPWSKYYELHDQCCEYEETLKKHIVELQAVIADQKRELDVLQDFHETLSPATETPKRPTEWLVDMVANYEASIAAPPLDSSNPAERDNSNQGIPLLVAESKGLKAEGSDCSKVRDFSMKSLESLCSLSTTTAQTPPYFYPQSGEEFTEGLESVIDPQRILFLAEYVPYKFIVNALYKNVKPMDSYFPIEAFQDGFCTSDGGWYCITLSAKHYSACGVLVEYTEFKQLLEAMEYTNLDPLPLRAEGKSQTWRRNNADYNNRLASYEAHKKPVGKAFPRKKIETIHLAINAQMKALANDLKDIDISEKKVQFQPQSNDEWEMSSTKRPSRNDVTLSYPPYRFRNLTLDQVHNTEDLKVYTRTLGCKMISGYRIIPYAQWKDDRMYQGIDSYIYSLAHNIMYLITPKNSEGNISPSQNEFIKHIEKICTIVYIAYGNDRTIVASTHNIDYHKIGVDLRTMLKHHSMFFLLTKGQSRKDGLLKFYSGSIAGVDSLTVSY